MTFNAKITCSKWTGEYTYFAKAPHKPLRSQVIAIQCDIYR